MSRWTPPGNGATFALSATLPKSPSGAALWPLRPTRKAALRTPLQRKAKRRMQMTVNRRQAFGALAVAATAPAVPLALTQHAVAQASAPLSPEEARAIAKEVFLWGMHPVAIYHLRYNQA